MAKYNFIIFDLDENVKGTIKNVVSAKHVSEVNGDNYLEIEFFEKQIEENYRILYHNRYYNTFHEFIVKEIYEYKQGDKNIYRVTAENSIVETLGDFLDERILLGKTLRQVTEDFLSETRWGHLLPDNDNSETHRRTIKIGKMNVRAALNIISEQFDVELKTVIRYNRDTKKINRFIMFEDRIGADRGQRFTYDKNSTEITRTIVSDNLCTALIAIGDEIEVSTGVVKNTSKPKVEDETPLITEVLPGEDLNKDADNDDEEETETKKVQLEATIKNDGARKRYGLVLANGDKKHIYRMKEYSGVKTQKELKRRANKDLATMSKPLISYEILVKDYIRILESGNGYIELGDTVRVVDRDFYPEINIKSRIIRMEIDLVNFENSVLDINDAPYTLNDRLVPGLNYEGFEDDTQGDANYLIGLLPRLRNGLSIWIDANDSSTISKNFDDEISEVRNIVSYSEDINSENGSGLKRAVFVQEDTDKAPTYISMYGYKWISFEPEEQIYNAWKYVDATSTPRPSGDKAVKLQDGQYLENLRESDHLQSVFIVFYDRTYPYISSSIFNPSTGYRAGYSTPLGLGWMSPREDGYSPGNKGYDAVFTGGSRSAAGWAVKRQRDRFMIVQFQPNGWDTIQSKIINLGMSKESYNSWRGLTMGYNGYRVIYEQNCFFRGEIGEIIAHTRTLDNEETAAVRKYLENKYRTTVIKV